MLIFIMFWVTMNKNCAISEPLAYIDVLVGTKKEAKEWGVRKGVHVERTDSGGDGSVCERVV